VFLLPGGGACRVVIDDPVAWRFCETAAPAPLDRRERGLLSVEAVGGANPSSFAPGAWLPQGAAVERMLNANYRGDPSCAVAVLLAPA
jgi:hypothetical protein